MLDHAVSFFGEMKKQCNGMYKTMKETQEQLGAEVEKGKKTQAELEAGKADLQAAQADLQVAKAESEGSRADLRACWDDLDVSRAEVASLRQALEVAQSTLDAEKASSSVAQAEKRNLQGKFVELISRMKGHAERAMERFRNSREFAAQIVEASIPVYGDGWTDCRELVKTRHGIDIGECPVGGAADEEDSTATAAKEEEGEQPEEAGAPDEGPEVYGSPMPDISFPEKDATGGPSST